MKKIVTQIAVFACLLPLLGWGAVENVDAKVISFNVAQSDTTQISTDQETLVGTFPSTYWAVIGQPSNGTASKTQNQTYNPADATTTTLSTAVKMTAYCYSGSNWGGWSKGSNSAAPSDYENKYTYMYCWASNRDRGAKQKTYVKLENLPFEKCDIYFYFSGSSSVGASGGQNDGDISTIGYTQTMAASSFGPLVLGAEEVTTSTANKIVDENGALVDIGDTKNWGTKGYAVPQLGRNVVKISDWTESSITLGYISWGGAVAAVQIVDVPVEHTEFAATVSGEQNWDSLSWDNTWTAGGDVAANVTLTGSGDGAKATLTTATTIGAFTTEGAVLKLAANGGSLTATSTTVNNALTIDNPASIDLGTTTIGSNGSVAFTGDGWNLGASDAILNRISTDGNKYTFTGTGTTGATLTYFNGSQNPSVISSHFIFDGGKHTMTYGKNNANALMGSGATEANPTILVKNNTTLDLSLKDPTYWSGTVDVNGIIQVANGGTLNFKKYGSNTCFYRQRLSVKPGATVTLDDNYSNGNFILQGGATQNKEQVYMGDSEANSAAANFTTTSGYVNLNKTDTTRGFAFYVGNNSTMNFGWPIKGSSGTAVAKWGAGRLKLSANTSELNNTVFAVNAGTLELGSANYGSFSVASGATIELNANVAYTISGITGAGNVVMKQGTLTQTFSNTGSFTLEGGTLTLDAGNESGVNVTGGKLKVTLTEAHRISGYTTTATTTDFTDGKIVFVIGEEEITPNSSGTLEPAAKMWNGTESNDWNTAANWSDSKVPAADDELGIAVTGDMTINLPADGTAALELVAVTGDAGSSLTLTGGKLNCDTLDLTGFSGTLKYTPGTQLDNDSVIAGGTTATIELAIDADTTVNTTISGSATLKKTGSGKLTLGTNAVFGAFNVTAGSLVLSSGYATGTFADTFTIAQNATAEIVCASDVTLSGAVSGNGTLKKSGSGKLTLTAGVASKYFDVIEGTLALPRNFTTNDKFNKEFTVRSGATMDMNGCANQLPTIHLDGGTLTNSGNDLTTGQKQIESLDLTADSTITGNTFGYIRQGYGAANLTLNGHKLTISMSSDKTFYWANITAKDTGTIELNSGSITTHGTSSTIADGVTLKVASAASLSTPVVLNVNGTLEMDVSTKTPDTTLVSNISVNETTGVLNFTGLTTALKTEITDGALKVVSKYDNLKYGYDWNNRNSAYTADAFGTPTPSSYVDGVNDKAFGFSNNSGGWYGDSGMAIGADTDFTIFLVAKSGETAKAVLWSAGDKNIDAKGIGFASAPNDGLTFIAWQSNSAMTIAETMKAANPTADYNVYVVEYDHTEQKYSYSVNGSAFTLIDTECAFSNPTRWQIGGIHGGVLAGYGTAADQTTGALDELQIYTDKLTLDEVRSMASNFLPNYRFVGSSDAITVAEGETLALVGSGDEEEATEWSGTITVNGTLKTYGNVKCSNGSNAVNGTGTLESVDGTLTWNSASQGIKGTLVIGEDSTFVNSLTSDALDYSGSPTVKVYGTLSMGATRWTIGTNNTLILYPGCTISGDGESTNGAIDFYNANTEKFYVDTTSNSTEDITLSCAFRFRDYGNATLTNDSAALVKISGPLYGGKNFTLAGEGLFNITSSTIDCGLCGTATLVYDNALPNDTVAGKLQNANWTGTVWIKNYGTAGNNKFVDSPAAFGNANSTLCLTGCNGYINNEGDFNIKLKVENGSSDYGWSNQSGWSTRTHVFPTLLGTGTLDISPLAQQCTEKWVINDISDFRGSIATYGTNGAGKRLVIGNDSSVDVDNGSIKLTSGKSAVIASGKSWTVSKAIIEGVISGSGTISGNAQFGNGATIDIREGVPTVSGTLTFGATTIVRVASAIGNDGVKVLSKTDAGSEVFATALAVYVGNSNTADDGFYELAADTDGIYVKRTATISEDGDVTTITVLSGKSITFASNYAIAEGKTLKIDAADANTSVTITGMISGAGTLEIGSNVVLGEFGQNRNISSKVKFDAATTVTFTEFISDDGIVPVFTLADGSQTPTYVIKDVNGDEKTITKGKYEIDVAGEACWYDWEFNGDLASVGVEKTTLTRDTNYGLAAAQSAYTSDGKAIFTAGNEYCTIYFSSQKEWSASIFTQLPPVKNAILMAFGTLSSGSIALITGDPEKNEVILARTTGNSPYEALATMTVPNATTASHLYSFCKSDKEITIYLDTVKWNRYTSETSINFGNGFQIGSLFEGIGNTGFIQYGKTYFDSETEANNSTISALRMFRTVLGPNAVAALAEEFSYVSPHGSYTRELTEDGTLTSENAWLNESDDTTVNLPAAGAALTIDVEADAAVTLTIDTDLTAEQITFSGDKGLTLATNGKKLTNEGQTTISVPLTIKAGAADITGGPTTMLDGGKIIFDYSEFDASVIIETTEIALSGALLEQAEGIITFVEPTEKSGCTFNFHYRSDWKQYVVEVTPSHEDGDTIVWANGGILTDDPTTTTAIFTCGDKTVTRFPNDVIELQGSETFTTLIAAHFTRGSNFTGELRYEIDQDEVTLVLDAAQFDVTKEGEGTLIIGGGSTAKSLTIAEGSAKVDAYNSLGYPVTVDDGATFDMNGKANSSAEVTLKGGATLTGSGAISTYDNIVKSVTLAGDAQITGSGNWGIVNPTQSTLALGNHTLNVNLNSAESTFFVKAGSTDAGSFKVTQGKLAFPSGNTFAAGTTFELAGGAITAEGTVAFGNTLTVKLDEVDDDDGTTIITGGNYSALDKVALTLYVDDEVQTDDLYALKTANGNLIVYKKNVLEPVPLDPEKPEDTQDIKIEKEWIAEAVIPEGKTVADKPIDGNGMAYWQSYVLGLDPNEETSKPIVEVQQTESKDTVGFKLGNVTVNTSAGVTPKFRILESSTPNGEATAVVPEGNQDDGWTEATDTAEIPLPTDANTNVKYFKVEIDFVPAN